MKPTEPQPSGPFGPSDAPDARAARKNGFMRQPNTQAEAQHTQPSVGSIAAHRPDTVAATVSGLEPDIDADLDAYEESEESQDGGARAGAVAAGRRRLLVRVQVRVDVRLQVGDRGGHGVRAVRGDGAHGGLRVLDLGLAVRLPHEPILPRRAQDRRVGRRGMLCSWWHGRLHSVRVARLSESMVTGT